MSVEIFKNSNSNSSEKGSDTNTIVKSDLLGDKKEENKSTIMNVQSLIPNVKPTLLKVLFCKICARESRVATNIKYMYIKIA
jgi:hypothetical protein